MAAQAEGEGMKMPSPEEFFDFYTKPMRGEADDELPALMWYYATDGNLLVCVFPDTPPPDQGGMQAMLKETLPRLRKEFGGASWIWFGAEAYAKTFDNPHPRLVPGELQAFHGLDPDIKEVVVLTGVDQLGSRTAQRPFRRTGTEVEWLADLEIELSMQETGGAIPEILAEGLER